MLRSDSASVYVFSIRLSLLVVPQSDGGVREVTSTTITVNDEGQPVVLIHKGEEALAVLPEPIPVGDTVFGHATLVYGFHVAPAGRERFVTVPRQEVTGFASPGSGGEKANGE